MFKYYTLLCFIIIFNFEINLFGQQSPATILNDSTELFDLGNGKTLKVHYKLTNGKSISIKEKNILLEKYPNIHREFNIKAAENIGEVILNMPDPVVNENKTKIKRDTSISKTLDIGQEQIGNMFPYFEWTCIDGEKYSLNDLEGKVVVLNFWHTSCVPCIAEMPLLNELKNRYHEEKVIFLASTPNSKEELERFLKKTYFVYHQVAKVNPEAFFKPFPGWPIHVVLDKKGDIIFLTLGKQKEIEKKLAVAINKGLQD